MPLRDHFHPPLSETNRWDALHGAWPTLIVMDLNSRFPPRYVASPRIHLGASFEIDDAASEQNEAATDQDEYEVRVFDCDNERLVAAIEIVSPANKNRPETRRAFAARCSVLLQRGVSVTIIDLVTVRPANLYCDLMNLLGIGDFVKPTPPSLDAVTCRWRRKSDPRHLEAWTHAMATGQPLPTVPLSLAEDFAVPLDLESTYQETCRILRIP